MLSGAGPGKTLDCVEQRRKVRKGALSSFLQALPEGVMEHGSSGAPGRRFAFERPSVMPRPVAREKGPERGSGQATV